MERKRKKKRKRQEKIPGNIITGDILGHCAVMNINEHIFTYLSTQDTKDSLSCLTALTQLSSGVGGSGFFEAEMKSRNLIWNRSGQNHTEIVNIKPWTFRVRCTSSLHLHKWLSATQRVWNWYTYYIRNHANTREKVLGKERLTSLSASTYRLF